MRIKLLLIVFVCFGAISCDNDNPSQQDNNSEISEEFDINSKIDFKSINRNGIGTEKDGKVFLNVEKEMIMLAFKNLVKKADLDLKPQSSRIIKVNDKNYLRFYSENNMVSTIALKNSNSKNKETSYIIIDDTVCTSEACASGGGCVPDGVYCTECHPPGTRPGGPKGDCQRTTTGG